MTRHETDVNGNTPIRDVRSRGIEGIHGAPEGAIIGGPGKRAVKVTAERFPDLDPVYVKERDHLQMMTERAAKAREAKTDG